MWCGSSHDQGRDSAETVEVEGGHAELDPRVGLDEAWPWQLGVAGFELGVLAFDLSALAVAVAELRRPSLLAGGDEEGLVGVDVDRTTDSANAVANPSPPVENTNPSCRSITSRTI